MNFDENEIISAAILGFDMIEGPILKNVETFVEKENEINIDYENFLMNFYLSFRGGNSGLKPTAILYDDFYKDEIRRSKARLYLLGKKGKSLKFFSKFFHIISLVSFNQQCLKIK